MVLDAETLSGHRAGYPARTQAAPAALETPPADPATGVLAVDEDTGVVEAIAAVTAIRDSVDDVEVGALAKSLRRQTPRLCVAHDWTRIAGRDHPRRRADAGRPAAARDRSRRGALAA